MRPARHSVDITRAHRFAALRRWRSACTALLALGGPALAHAAGADGLLTAAEVAQTTAIADVQPWSATQSPWARGDLNFGTAGGGLLLSVSVRPAAQFAVWKRRAEEDAKPLPNLGDAAFESTGNHYICLRHGERAACIEEMSGADPAAAAAAGSAPRITTEQLRSLAARLAPRL